MLLELPLEVLHRIAYEYGILGATDVRELLLTCKGVYQALRGTEFDLTQHRALTGLLRCTSKQWSRAAMLAFDRFGATPNDFKRVCCIGNAKLVNYMMPRRKVQDGELFLSLLASRNQFEIIELLLKNGVVCATLDAYCEAAKRGYTATATLIRLYSSEDRLDVSLLLESSGQTGSPLQPTTSIQ